MVVPFLGTLLVALVASSCATSPEGVIPTLDPVSPTQVANGSVRLADGPIELEGRVEIFYNGSWLTVCDDIFGIEEAEVVCQQLGFEAAISYKCCSQYGYTDLPGIFKDFECTGLEDNLLSCPHTEAGYDTCSYRHAGVVCRGELTPCPLPVGTIIDWDALYQCEYPYFQEFLFEYLDYPVVPGEVFPFLTVANLIDAAGAVWESNNLVQGIGHFCRLVAPRLAATGPDVFRGLCGPVLTALSDGTDLDGEQICRFIYSIATPRPYTGAPYTPDTNAPYNPSTETPSTPITESNWTPGKLSTDYPFSISSLTPIICILPSEYLFFSEGPPFGVDSLQDLDIFTLLTQTVENVLNITSYDEDTVCSAVGHLTSRDYAPREIAIDFMTELLAGLYPAVTEICENWDDIVETILSESSNFYYSYDVEIMVDEIPALIALLTDFPDRETLCLSIRTATLLGEDAVYASARFMVENVLNVLTNQEKCVSLFYSTLTVIDDTSDGVTLDVLESYYLPRFTGFDDVQEICQYIGTSFSPRHPALQVRLVDGETPNEGRVEVQYAGKWGTVCDDDFDNDDAIVVCRQLGYRGEAVSLGNQTPGTGEILLDDVGCLGVESSIGQCPNAGISVHNCDHSEDVSVTCSLEVTPQPPYPPSQSSTTPSTTDIGFLLTRLVGGSTENEGRLEVFYQGQWGTVCDDLWTASATDVACRSLGFQGGEGFSCCAEYGEGDGPIILDDVICTGEEDSIESCSHSRPLDHNCGHSEDIGISCIPNGAGTGAVRLVGGSNEAEGRIEIQYNGVWGTICDDLWDINDASVACRMLGFQGASGAPGLAQFGQGTGPIQLDDVGCSGDEQTIFDCEHPAFGAHNCGHYEDAGVVCIASGGTGGAVRLVGGNNKAEGRVEIQYNGIWGTICDDSWGINDANVVCRMLGFQGASGAPGSSQFGQGTGPIQLDDVGCSGDEATIFDCAHPAFGVHNCVHYEDAGVVCIDSAGTDGAVRLVGGSNEAEGRVEIQYNGVWGTICDDSWGINDANVVCRMLGFQGASGAPGSSQFGQGTGPIQLDDVGCTGAEQTIFDCEHPAFGVHNCVHYEDAGVVCIASTAVRLVGGSSETEGRVEIQYNGVWGTICDDSWGINDANVVCRMLGYQGASGAPGSAQFGQGTGPIQLDDVGCSGDEETIFDCEHPAFGVHNCVHYEDAGVVCIASTGTASIRLVDGSSSNEGRVEVNYNGQWGTVCDDLWDDTDATVVCQILGLGETGNALGSAAFGQGSGDIILDNVQCVGTEADLFSCPSNGPLSHNCGHYEDAGVQCTSTSSAVRLVGGSNGAEGRVEIQYSGVWGTICDDSWGINDANVVCRMLGYQGASGAPGSAHFGQGTGPIQLDDVDCSGEEQTIFDCAHPAFGAHNCGHYEDAGVICIASAGK